MEQWAAARPELFPGVTALVHFGCCRICLSTATTHCRSQDKEVLDTGTSDSAPGWVSFFTNNKFSVWQQQAGGCDSACPGMRLFLLCFLFTLKTSQGSWEQSLPCRAELWIPARTRQPSWEQNPGPGLGFPITLRWWPGCVAAPQTCGQECPAGTPDTIPNTITSICSWKPAPLTVTAASSSPLGAKGPKFSVATDSDCK